MQRDLFYFLWCNILILMKSKLNMRHSFVSACVIRFAITLANWNLWRLWSKTKNNQFAITFLPLCFDTWEVVIERESDSSHKCQEKPASTDDTFLYSCLLLTSLTLVFYHLNLTENREREEKTCLTIDKPQRLLLNTVWKTRTNW